MGTPRSNSGYALAPKQFWKIFNSNEKEHKSSEYYERKKNKGRIWISCHILVGKKWIYKTIQNLEISKTAQPQRN